uniref:Uncharacterized protein n=1 Tax=Ananas comosus var. bracteatus TaxID=296719 RepID=A0A6V7PDN7_ANACO|nr:unnamed protein product [Ananas comosus var. bracteatus]
MVSTMQGGAISCSFTYFGQRDAAIKPEISCVLNGLNHAGRGYKVHKNKYKGYSVSLDGSQQIAAKGIKNQSKRVKISDSSREEHCSDLTMRHNSKQISLSRDESLLLYRKCTASIMSDITKLRRIVESKGRTPIALEHNRRLLDLVIEPALKLMELDPENSKGVPSQKEKVVNVEFIVPCRVVASGTVASAAGEKMRRFWKMYLENVKRQTL